MTLADQNNNRFRILVCIDGSEESYQGLRYASRLGSGLDADITMVYVRPVDQGLNSGGLQVRVARQNMMDWDLDLPGIRYLKKGRDLLIELGHMEEDWIERTTHVESRGDPLGDNMIEYSNEEGKQIRLWLKVAETVEGGIMERWEKGKHDLIILGVTSDHRSKLQRVFGIAPIALKVATNAESSVLVGRAIEEGKGHLICTDGSEDSLNMIRKDAHLASRCNCPISLISVAPTEQQRGDADQAIEKSKALLDEMNIPVEKSIVRVGDPVKEIIKEGEHHSVVVVSGTRSSGLQKYFMSGIAFSILENSKTSVLIVR
ncbi:MAG: universal stress protein [Magnetococcales bacterium]|nr:universal stress protein [Magnetococcales bacterium]